MKHTIDHIAYSSTGVPGFNEATWVGDDVYRTRNTDGWQKGGNVPWRTNLPYVPMGPYDDVTPVQPWNGNPTVTMPYITTITTGGSEEEEEVSYERPYNTYVDIDGNYHIDLLIAGYARDQVEVSSVNQTVKVTLFKDHQSEFVSEGPVEDVNQYDHIGIVVEDEEVEFEVPDEFVVDDLKAGRYDDGILRMVFRKKEAKKHGIA